MAEKKLFDLATETTPSNSALRVAYGDAATSAKNITLGDLRAWFLGTSGLVKQRTVELGSWDMNTDPAITHRIYLEPSPGTPTIISKIRGVSSIIISNDGESEFWDFYSDGTGNPNTTMPLVSIHQVGGGTPYLNIMSRNDGLFRTNANFNDSTINRGWVVFNYID